MQGKYPVRIHIRRRAEDRGLSSAVVLGFRRRSTGPFYAWTQICNMNPKPFRLSRRQFSTGMPGARWITECRQRLDWENWPLHRRIISKVATMLAWPVAASTTRCLASFAHREVFKRGETSINATGFKIGLEMMVRCRVKSVEDVRFVRRGSLAKASYPPNRIFNT